MPEHPEPNPMAIATRAYTVPVGQHQRKSRTPTRNEFPDTVLVFDCETTVDERQALTFGVYRVYKHRRSGTETSGGWTLIEEGLFHADDLPESDRQTLAGYCKQHPSDAPTTYGVGRKPLALRSRTSFVDEVFYPLAVEPRALVVGFNLPFDLSRLAVGCGTSRFTVRGDNTDDDACDDDSGADTRTRGGERGQAGTRRWREDDGFSLIIWQVERDGRLVEHPYRPRIAVKTIDSKRAIIQFRGRERSGKRAFRGHFLDLRTLAFALSNRGHSLASACTAFGVEHGKVHVAEHGVITTTYIDYARRDVLATWELFEKLRAEYLTHPITLQATKAYSPASIGKAYLDAMGLDVPDFAVDRALGSSPEAVVGACMQAYYGGRAECRIRKTPVPVIYTDFTSMYPTVNTLMGLWAMLTAERVRVVDATDEVRAFLATVTLDDLFQPETWRRLAVLVRVRPGGDVLPVRAAYDGPHSVPQIGINHLTSAAPLWYTLADVVAAKLLGGTVPEIVQAIRFMPQGQQSGLRPVKLRGALAVDPCTDDFFKTVIERRKSLPPDLPPEERARLDAFLKVLANSTSYGIFIELHQQDGQHADCDVWTGEAEPFTCTVENPEEAGLYFFPPLATLITGAARLMLALLERTVRDMGGTYAFCDTDSMAIVASPGGGPLPYTDDQGRKRDDITALSWEQVHQIVQRFASLNPYDPARVPGSVLKIEDVNYAPCGLPDHPRTCICIKAPRPLYTIAISAKRYALYVLDEQGEPIIVDAKAHGLGHLMDPTDREARIAPDGVDEDTGGAKFKGWQRDVWANIVRDALGLPEMPLPWRERPAVGRITVSKPAVLRPFDGRNAGKPYAEQVKPQTFIITTFVARLGYPLGVDAAHFRLIAPFETDPRRWEHTGWLNLYDPSGTTYAVTTRNGSSPQMVQVKSYGDVVEEYRYHPEAKSAAPDGTPAAKQTVGLLGRRRVRAVAHRFIGKESNKLGAVEDGVIGDLDDVLTEYAPPGTRLALVRNVAAVVGTTDLARRAGMSERRLADVLDGRATPRPATLKKVEGAAHDALRERLRSLGAEPPGARLLPVDVLHKLVAEVDVGATRRLTTLLACVSERDAAGVLGVPRSTLNGWRRHGMPRVPRTLADISKRLSPYVGALDQIADLDASEGSAAIVERIDREHTRLRERVRTVVHASSTRASYADAAGWTVGNVPTE